LATTGAGRLVVLGDLLHAREGRHPATLAAIAAWRARHEGVRVELVRGNHDLRAGDPPPELGITCVDGPVVLGGLAGVHDPADAEDGVGEPAVTSAGGLAGSRFLVAGHLHPSVVLRGRGRQRLRLPCFVVGPSRALLPAFTWFTGGGAWAPAPGDRCFAVAEGEVIAVE
jgi:metallophosphoesterase superfamily enzyme